MTKGPEINGTRLFLILPNIQQTRFPWFNSKVGFICCVEAI